VRPAFLLRGGGLPFKGKKKKKANKALEHAKAGVASYIPALSSHPSSELQGLSLSSRGEGGAEGAEEIFGHGHQPLMAGKQRAVGLVGEKREHARSFEQVADFLGQGAPLR